MDLQRQPKYLFLDGLRGACAVFIAMYHAQLFTGNGFKPSELTVFLQPISYILGFGHYSISVFIILSGFCLTIPVAKSGSTYLIGGISNYLRRRAFRILPPYYFALALFLVMIAALPILHTVGQTAWDSKIPVTKEAIISHVFLYHNLSKEWFLKIDGPMWSVATEWQIYFIFPLLLLVWRRSNLVISCIVALCLGYAPFLAPTDYNLEWAHPWYLGLFAFGMSSAIIVFSPNLTYVKLRDSVKWDMLGKLALAALPLFLLTTRFILPLHASITETIVGILCCFIIIRYTLIERQGTSRPLLLKAANSKTAAYLGKFSYSIYLIHSPFLALMNLLTIKIALNINHRLILMELIAVPVAIAVSYIFYQLVESKYSLSKLKPTRAQLTADI